jgi:sugar phosphate permease
MAEAALGGSGHEPPAMESDFSLRKIKIATVILLGQTFASSILPYVALGYVMPSMTREFGWSKTEFLLANSFLMWCGALTVWPMGGITDRIGARPIILVGTVGVAALNLLLPHVNGQLWQFYVLFALMGVFGSSGASYSKLTTALFTQNRGKAMALFGVEGTFARMIIPGATAFLILRYGWRGMFNTFGAITLLMIPLIFLFLEEAGTRGLKPSLGFGRRAKPAAGDTTAVVIPFEGKSFREILRDGVFWALLLAILVGMFVGNGMIANIPTSLVEHGFGLQTIGTADSIATLAGIPGLLLAGWMMDRFPSTKVAVPFLLITAVSAWMTMVVTPTFGGTSLLIAARSLYMFAFTTSLPLSAYFMTRFFGLKAYATSYGFMSAIQAACIGFAPPLMGYLRERTGSYDIGYQAWAAASVFAAVVYALLPRYRFSASIGAMPAPPKGGEPPGDASPVPAE